MIGINSLNNEIEIPLNKVLHEKVCEEIIENRDSVDEIIWAIKSLEQEKMLGLCFYYLTGGKYPILKNFGTFDELMKDDEAVSLIAGNEILVSAIIMTGKDIYGDIFSKNQIVQNTVLNSSKTFEALASEKYSALNFLENPTIEYLNNLFKEKEAVLGFCKSPWAIFLAMYWSKAQHTIFNDCDLIDSTYSDIIRKTAYFNEDIFTMKNKAESETEDGIPKELFYIGTHREFKCSNYTVYDSGQTEKEHNKNKANTWCLHYIYNYRLNLGAISDGTAYTLSSNRLLWTAKEQKVYTKVCKCIFGGIKGRSIVVTGNVFIPDEKAIPDYLDR